MHILLIPSWYPMPTKPLIGTFFREHANALKSSGHKVGVVAVNQQSIKGIGKLFNNGKVHRSDDFNIPTYIREIRACLPFVPYGNAYLNIRAIHRIINIYIEDNGVPDLIHAHSAFYGGLAAVTYKIKIKTILTEHNSGFLRGLFDRSWQKKIMNNVLQRVDAKIAVSEAFSISLQHLFPSAGPWHTVPNIVDKRFFQTLKDQPNTGMLTFLNIGFLTQVKGQKALILAFSDFCRKVSNVRLLIGGDGPLLGELTQFTSELGMEEKIIFLGNLDRHQVHYHMCTSNFFVLTSHFETFGVVVIEALAAGLPILSTKSGGPEGIINEKNGILVENFDHEALVNGLLTIYENRDLYDKSVISQDCYSRFSAEAISKRLNIIYQNVSINNN